MPVPGRRERMPSDVEAGRLTRGAAIARSGLRRYPRELLDSLKKPGPGPVVVGPPVLATNFEFPEGSPIAAAWLGHATVLLNVGGTWILTDPVFSHRIGIRLGGLTIGPKRVLDLAHHPEALPPIDLVLISHAHFDHLDRPTLARLARPETMVVTAANTGRLIPRGFGDVREIGWDQTLDVGDVAIGAIRPAHWGARTAWDRHRGYNSYVIESRRTGPASRVLYAGDTAFTDVFRGVGTPHLSIFGIGAYDPWIRAHATPEQVWAMHEHAGAKYLLPIHHSTFVLSDEPLDEPLARLVRAAGHAGDRIVAPRPGEVWAAPAEQ